MAISQRANKSLLFDVSALDIRRNVISLENCGYKVNYVYASPVDVLNEIELAVYYLPNKPRWQDDSNVIFLNHDDYAQYLVLSKSLKPIDVYNYFLSGENHV